MIVLSMRTKKNSDGTKCGVGLEIAAQSILDNQEGKTINEFRTKIDSLYKEGYAADPSPTPKI
jgi:Protein of unknown function with PCYCGC motif